MRALQSVILLAASFVVQAEAPQKTQGESSRKVQKGESFELVMTGLSNQWTAIRYNPATGSSSIFSGEVWVPIKEAKGFAERRRSRYIIKVTAFGSSNDFAAIRMDQKSGATWFLRDQRWVPIAEFEE